MTHAYDSEASVVYYVLNYHQTQYFWTYEYTDGKIIF